MTSTFFTTQLVCISADTNQEAIQKWLQEKLAIDIPGYNWIWLNEPSDSVNIKLIRDLQTQCAYATAGTRVFIIWNLDSASLAAQNALLKIVEEPPQETQLILLTHGLPPIIPTLQSRAAVTYLTSKNQSSEMNDLPINLSTVTPKEVLAWVETISDRDVALEICQLYLEKGLTKNQNISLKEIQQAKLLQEAWSDLSSNLNVKLTLEHYFLAIAMLNKPLQ